MSRLSSKFFWIFSNIAFGKIFRYKNYFIFNLKYFLQIFGLQESGFSEELGPASGFN